MDATTMHPEDIRAILRKRFGSIEAFANARGIKSQAVRDVLRGKARGAITELAEELGIDPDQLTISRIPVCGMNGISASEAQRQSEPIGKRAHRLSGGAK